MRLSRILISLFALVLVVGLFFTACPELEPDPTPKTETEQTSESQTPTTISVTGVSLNHTELSVIQGSTSTELGATVYPENATNKELIWQSSEETIVSVSNDGTLLVSDSATSGSKVTISVTTVDGNFSASCDVTVVVLVKSVKLNRTNLELEIGGEVYLNATVQPTEATNKDVVWSVSGNDGIVVDQNGHVSIKDDAVINSFGYVRVTTVDQNKIAECYIRIVASGVFKFEVEGVFNVSGKGVVVSGVVKAGTVRTNDSVTIYTSTGELTAKVHGIERFKTTLDSATVGNSVGLILGNDVTTDQVSPYDIVVGEGYVPVYTTKVKATIIHLTKEEGGRLTPIFSGYKPQFWFRGSSTTCKFTFDGDQIAPGETRADVTIEFDSPIYEVNVGMSFLGKESGKTVLRGVIDEILGTK